MIKITFSSFGGFPCVSENLSNLLKIRSLVSGESRENVKIAVNEKNKIQKSLPLKPLVNCEPRKININKLYDHEENKAKRSIIR